MINAIQTALSGLQAAAKKVEAGASNIANMQTTGSLKEGEKAPYHARTVVQESQGDGGVKADVVAKQPPFVPAYDPDSPFADENGQVGVPNVDLAEEAVNINLAEIAYKANLKTFQAIKDMEEELLRSFDERV